MIKKNKWNLIMSSAVIMLPAVFGLAMWDRLPDTLNTHWGADGVVDGGMSKSYAISILPLIILALHWLCVLATAKDPDNQGQNRKIFSVVLWLCPMISLFANGVVYASAMGWEFEAVKLPALFLGMMFLLLGNYMPKCSRNRTIGIKVKWTLASDENWNATHRLAGRLWVICGVLMMACVFLPDRLMLAVMCVVLLTAVTVPFVYSYVYYRRQLAAGSLPAAEQTEKSRKEKIATGIWLVIAAAILVGALVLCFTGSIAVRYEEDSFTIEASYWSDLTVDYSEIDSVEYREDCDAGMRTSGWGTPRLSLGTFLNDEFGYYTRYAYTGSTACVVLNVDGKVLVISGDSTENTREIYERISGYVTQ